MSGALDLSLDDLIKSSSKPKGGRGGRTGGRGAGRKGIAVRAKPTVGKAPRARNAGPSVRPPFQSPFTQPGMRVSARRVAALASALCQP